MDIDVFKVLALSLLAGFIVGLVFTMLKLPLPAPPQLAGIMGILGVFLGYKCWHWILETYFKSQ